MNERWGARRIFECANEMGLDIDSVCIMNGSDKCIDDTFFYVMGGLDAGLFERSACILTEEDVHIITSPLEETTARKGPCTVHTVKRPEEMKGRLREILAGSSRVGMNAAGLTHANYLFLRDALGEHTELVDISLAVRRARAVKSEEEIEHIRRACEISSRAFEDMLPLVRPGMKEQEVAAELNYRMENLGSQGTAFTTIAAFGKNAAEPHYTSGGTPLEEGGALVLDFGAVHRRYRSDISRTLPVGRVDERLSRMYEVVREAQNAAIEFIRAGVEAKDADAAAREVIDASEFRDRFIHSLGHGLGLSTHDGLGLSPLSDFKLEEGMVFTVEPGIYLPGEAGVRLEDDIVVRQRGAEVLTTASRAFE